MNKIRSSVVFIIFILNGLVIGGSATACDKPANVKVSSVTITTATISWSPVVGVLKYRLYYRKSGTVNWTMIIIGAKASARKITGLAPATAYQFKIRTVCDGTVLSAFSTVQTFTTTIPPCNSPGNLTVTDLTATSARISWSKVTYALSYSFQYRLMPAGNWNSVSADSNFVTLNSLLALTNYECKVQTICPGGTSAFSSVLSFTTNMPRPPHIVMVIMENKAYEQIIGSVNAPFINGLLSDSNAALFIHSYALTHPSQPNYLHIYSGSNQGVTDNNISPNSPFTTPNLGYQLINSGFSFATYSEDLPSVGFNGASSGAYMRKHNPVTNWMGSGTNQVPATTNQPFSAFPSNFSLLPTVSYVVPNQNNDMHDGTITAGDNWIKNQLSSYMNWARSNNSLLIIHFDEDDNAHNNRVTTIFFGPMVKNGSYADTITHHTLLRTIEDMYGLPYAGGASTAKTIVNCWKQIPSARLEEGLLQNESGESNDIIVSPNPFTHSAQLFLSLHENETGKLELVNLLGQTQIIAENLEGTSGQNFYNLNFSKEDFNVTPGIYLLKFTKGDKLFSKKIIVE